MSFDSSDDFTDAISSLTRLLYHIINDIYHPDFPTTSLLRYGIGIDVKYIYHDELFATLGDDDFKTVFEKLVAIVGYWDNRVGCSEEERAELEQIIQDLWKYPEFRQRAGGGDAPKMESKQYQEGVKKSSKVLPWGRVRKLLKRES